MTSLTPANTVPLSLDDVGVTLDGRPIVRHVSLDVDRGQVVAILGANGSGKSTLLKALVGLNPVSQGVVSLFGTAQSAFHAWERVGYVPQRSNLGPGVPATVREVVASGRVSRRRPFWPMSRHEQDLVDAAIDVVGLTGRAGQPVATLSGGQQQRVLVARTLAGEPDLLLLDEPNAGVDHASQLAIAETLGGRADAGASIVVVLHELGPFAPLIDRVVALREGRVTYDGPPDQLSDGASPHTHHHDHYLESTRTVPPLQAPLEGGR